MFLCAAARMSELELEQRTNIKVDREEGRKILSEDLDMREVCAKMVPKELTEEQKQRKVFSY